MSLAVPKRWIAALIVAALVIGAGSWLLSSRPAVLSWPAGAMPGVAPVRPALDLPWPGRVIALGEGIFVPIRPWLLMALVMLGWAAALGVLRWRANGRGETAEPSTGARGLVVGGLGVSAVVVAFVTTPPDLITALLAAPVLFVASTAAWSLAALLASVIVRGDGPP